MPHYQQKNYSCDCCFDSDDSIDEHSIGDLMGRIHYPVDFQMGGCDGVGSVDADANACSSAVAEMTARNGSAPDSLDDATGGYYGGDDYYYHHCWHFYAE